MIHFIYGTAKSGKTEYILNLLKDKALNDISTTLFVPEQFSFETERETIERLGESAASDVKIYSFSWLCDELKKQYGGAAYKYVDDGVRHLLMLKAIKALKGELRIFKGDPEKVIDILINAVKEFKMSGVSSSDLFRIAESFSDSVMKNKVLDIALIMSTYNSLLANKYIDPIDDLDFAYETIKNNAYFKDKTVIFDGFSSFTGQQNKIIKQIIKDSKDVYFSLCTDGNIEDSFSVFAPVNKTVKYLSDYAKNQAGKKIAEPVKLNHKLYDSEDISFIGDFFENSPKKKFDVENISALTFSGKYDECEYAANVIHKLCRDKDSGLRYRNFAFICRNAENYSGFIKSIFDKYNIPIYVNESRCLSEALLSNYLILLLSAAKTYKSNIILRLIKTGLTDVSEKELFDLDNYIYLWNIDKSQWETEWTFNPLGLKTIDDNAEKIEAKLESLNKTRIKIVKLLKPFHFLKNASGMEFAQQIFDTIEKASIAKRLKSFVDVLKKNCEHSEADFQIASWDAIVNVLDIIVDAFGDDNLSYSEFSSIFQKCLSMKSIGGIPQGLDEVVFTTPEKLRTYDIKVAFIAGLNYGVFPNNSSNKGVFSTIERASLSSFIEGFSDRSIDSALDENFLLYKSLTSPKSKLFLMNYLSEYSGSSCQISPVYSSICSYLDITPEFIDINEFGLNSIESKTQALSLASNSLRTNKKVADKIFETLSVDPIMKAKIDLVKSGTEVEEAQISEENAKLIFGSKLDVSPSKIESYYECPYSFFCKYGLSVHKRNQIDFLVMQRGNIAHYVMENLISDFFIKTPRASTDKLNEMIDNYVIDYVNGTVGSYDKLDAHSKYILSRINDMLYELSEYIISELNASGFKPKAIEFNIDKDSIVPPLKIDTEKGSVFLSGKIDRVDIAEIDGKNYIRIVDYKTGKKKFSFSDILLGINLQMLVYLAAICESPVEKFFPAGVVYQPLNHIKREGIEAKIDNKHSPKAKGILINEIDILKIMDPLGLYMPFKLNKATKKKAQELSKKSTCISENDFSSVFDFLKEKVADMHVSLLNGKIGANPYANDNNITTCGYCDYKDVCRYKVVDKSVESFSIEETLKIIKEGDNDEEN